MKIEIEEYKGQLIHYDDYSDKFTCDISIEDSLKSTKRQSLNDVRKEIDQFIKVNVNFKPFKALMLDAWSNENFSVIHVLGIRTDGVFVVSDTEDGKRKSHLEKKDMKRAMIFSEEAVLKKQELEKERDDAAKKCRDGIAELCKGLTPCDLSKYDHIQ